MKKTTILLAALAVGTVAHAQAPQSTYSVTADFSYASEYIYRGIERSDAAFQPSVEVAVGDTYAGIWTNQPLLRNQNNEIDLYAGYKWQTSDALSFEVLGTYYWYPEASGGATKHTWEGGIGGTFTTGGVSTSVYYYYDFTLEASTLQGSVGYSFPLTDIGSSLDFSIYAGTVDADDFLPDSGATVSEKYSYWGVDLSIPYKLNDTATFTLGAHYAKNSSLPAGTPDSNLWWTAGLTVGF